MSAASVQSEPTRTIGLSTRVLRKQTQAVVKAVSTLVSTFRFRDIVSPSCLHVVVMTVEQSRRAVRSVIPIQSPKSAAGGEQEGKEEISSVAKVSNPSSRQSRAKTHENPYIEGTRHRRRVKRTTDEKREEKRIRHINPFSAKPISGKKKKKKKKKRN